MFEAKKENVSRASVLSSQTDWVTVILGTDVVHAAAIRGLADVLFEGETCGTGGVNEETCLGLQDICEEKIQRCHAFDP